MAERDDYLRAALAQRGASSWYAPGTAPTVGGYPSIPDYYVPASSQRTLGTFNLPPGGATAPEQYQDAFGYGAQVGRVDPQLLQNIGWQESRFNPNLRYGNAEGMMQLMAGRQGVQSHLGMGSGDAFDPDYAIPFGANYLGERNRVPSGGITSSLSPGEQAVWYNTRPSTFNRFRNEGPASLPIEAQNYMWNVGQGVPGGPAIDQQMNTMRDAGYFNRDPTVQRYINQDFTDIGGAPGQNADRPQDQFIRPGAFGRGGITSNWALPSGDDYAPQGQFPGRQRSLDDLFQENFRLDEPTPNDGGPRRAPDRLGFGSLDELSGASRNYQDRFGTPYSLEADQPPADRNEAYRPGTDQRTWGEREIGGLGGWLGREGNRIYDTSADLAGRAAGGMGDLADWAGALPPSLAWGGARPGAGGFEDRFGAAGAGRLGGARALPGQDFDSDSVWPGMQGTPDDLVPGMDSNISRRVLGGFNFGDGGIDLGGRFPGITAGRFTGAQNPDVWPDINQPQGNWMAGWRSGGNFPRQGLDPVASTPTFDADQWMPDWRGGGDFDALPRTSGFSAASRLGLPSGGGGYGSGGFSAASRLSLPSFNRSSYSDIGGGGDDWGSSSPVQVYDTPSFGSPTRFGGGLSYGSDPISRYSSGIDSGLAYNPQFSRGGADQVPIGGTAPQPAQDAGSSRGGVRAPIPNVPGSISYTPPVPQYHAPSVFVGSGSSIGGNAVAAGYYNPQTTFFDRIGPGGGALAPGPAGLTPITYGGAYPNYY